MKKDELFLEYMESQNSIKEYAGSFKKENLISIKQKFYEKAGLNNSSVKIPEKRNRRAKFRTWIAATLVFCLLTGVIAFGVIDMSPLINIIGEKFGTVLQPINMADEYDGIELKTLAAINDDDMVYIYFTLTDLKENRIDSKIDIYDFVVKNTMGLNCEVIGFDEATKTATLRITGSGGRKLNGKNLSMRIDSFLTGAKRHEFDTGLNLAEIIYDAKNTETEFISLDRITGGSYSQDTSKNKKIELLKKDELSVSIPGLDWLVISNIGFVNGKLHIQVNPDSNMGRFNHGYFYFADTMGDPVHYNTENIYFGEYKLGNITHGGGYIEYIFDISDIKELEGLKLMGAFTVYDRYISGKWENRFTVNSIGGSKEIDTNIAIEGATIKKVVLSPLGINFVAQGEPIDKESQQLPMYDFDVIIHYENGESEKPYTVMYYAEPGQYNIKYVSSELIDVEKVTSVSINGELIDFSQ